MDKIMYCKEKHKNVDNDDCVSCVQWDDCNDRVEAKTSTKILAWLLIFCVSGLLLILVLVSFFNFLDKIFGG